MMRRLEGAPLNAYEGVYTEKAAVGEWNSLLGLLSRTGWCLES